MSDSFPDPMDCSPPGSSVHGISQARILEWVDTSFSEDLRKPGVKPAYPTLAGGFFTAGPLGSPFRREYWSGLPFPPPGDPANRGIQPAPPASPALQADSLLADPSGPAGRDELICQHIKNLT